MATTTTRNHIEISRIDTSGNLFILYPKNTIKDVYTSSTSGVTIEGKVNFFGICDTAAASAAKTVSINGFSLIAGAHLTVVFTNGISVANATLNINGAGAKAIYFEGSALKANAVREKARVHMVYDGNYFHVLSGASNAAYVSNANTTKFYLLGTPTNASGSPTAEYFDTGVYVSTTEGQLVANTMQANTFYLGGTSASINSTNYTGQAATVGTISGYLVDSCASGSANGVTTKALTANQGYLLQNQINTLNSNLSNHTHDYVNKAGTTEYISTPVKNGYTTDEFGNFVHKQSEIDDYIHFDSFDKQKSLEYYWESGNLRVPGNISASNLSPIILNCGDFSHTKDSIQSTLMHLFENLPVGRVEGTFVFNGIWRFYGYIYDDRQWGNIIAYHYNAEKHVLKREEYNYSYWVEDVKRILDGQKNLTVYQSLFSNSLTTSNKQMVGSENKNVYIGNTDLENIYFQFAGKTVSFSNLGAIGQIYSTALTGNCSPGTTTTAGSLTLPPGTYIINADFGDIGADNLNKITVFLMNGTGTVPVCIGANRWQSSITRICKFDVTTTIFANIELYNGAIPISLNGDKNYFIMQAVSLA